MNTHNSSKREQFSFIFKVTVIVCAFTIAGIYFGFSSYWVGLPTDLGTLIVFGSVASILIAAPVTFWASDQIRRDIAATQDLAIQSHTDYLSGAMSRAYFDNFMTKDQNLKGVILMIDIDNFKTINDTYGHIVGDHTIKKIGQLIKSSIRERDSFYRFGGEEFVVFLVDTTLETGHDIATRICENIANSPIVTNDTKFQVTVSIGGAPKRLEVGFKNALSEADKNLYHVKKTGRNNVNFSDQTSLG